MIIISSKSRIKNIHSTQNIHKSPAIDYENWEKKIIIFVEWVKVGKHNFAALKYEICVDNNNNKHIKAHQHTHTQTYILKILYYI